jgi:hypothetical protein
MAGVGISVSAVAWSSLETPALIVIGLAALIVAILQLHKHMSGQRLTQRQKGGDHSQNIQAGGDTTILSEPMVEDE